MHNAARWSALCIQCGLAQFLLTDEPSSHCTDSPLRLKVTDVAPKKRHFPIKIAPSHVGTRPSSNAWFLGHTRVHNRKGILIGSAFFAGLTIVTDRQTDRPTDHASPTVTVGRIYVRSTAMRPENLTSDQTNLTTGRIAAALGRFSGIHQVAPACTPSNTCFVGLTRVHNPNGISIGLAIFALLTAVCRRASRGMSFPLKIASSHGAIWN